MRELEKLPAEILGEICSYLCVHCTDPSPNPSLEWAVMLYPRSATVEERLRLAAEQAAEQRRELTRYAVFPVHVIY